MNNLVRQCFRYFSVTSSRSQKLKVTVCGAAGNTGRILSYCLKTSAQDIHLSLFDTSTEVKYLADQLNLISTSNTIEEHVGPLKLRNSLKDSDVVVIVAKSKPIAPKSQLMDSFEMNFPIVTNIARCCMEMCPEAVLAIGTNPVNFIVPGVNELLTLQGYQHSHKILGITTMDVMQACMVYAEFVNTDPTDVFVPITGGTTVETVTPIFSQAAVSAEKAPAEFTVLESERLHNRFIGRKKSAEHSFFPNGFAIAQFVESIVRALNGEKEIVETAFVAAPDEAPARYMISLIDLDQYGIETVYGPPKTLNRFEKKLIYPALLNLQRDINQAEIHAQSIAKTSIELCSWK